MANNDNIDKRDKTTEAQVEDTPHGQLDQMNIKAVQEASRLGTSDKFLVKSDLEDIDERLDGDMPDGNVSPMANADNPER